MAIRITKSLTTTRMEIKHLDKMINTLKMFDFDTTDFEELKKEKIEIYNNTLEYYNNKRRG